MVSGQSQYRHFIFALCHFWANERTMGFDWSMFELGFSDKMGV
jgi:hypothetical protein